MRNFILVISSRKEENEKEEKEEEKNLETVFRLLRGRGVAWGKAQGATQESSLGVFSPEGIALGGRRWPCVDLVILGYLIYPNFHTFKFLILMT